MATIYCASDHAGFELKQKLVSFLTGLGHSVVDCGPEVYVETDDYPLYVQSAARKVAQDRQANIESFGIILGASGQGEAIAVNRIPHIRSVVYYGEPCTAHVQIDADGHELSLLQSTRLHNNANILSLGAKFLTQQQAEEAVVVWLNTPFSGEERHVRRLAEIEDNNI
jgi:ribose 5-phosphate isomerase B